MSRESRRFTRLPARIALLVLAALLWPNVARAGDISVALERRDGATVVKLRSDQGRLPTPHVAASTDGMILFFDGERVAPSRSYAQGGRLGYVQSGGTVDRAAIRLVQRGSARGRLGPHVRRTLVPGGLDIEVLDSLFPSSTAAADDEAESAAQADRVEGTTGAGAGAAAGATAGAASDAAPAPTLAALAREDEALPAATPAASPGTTAAGTAGPAADEPTAASADALEATLTALAAASPPLAAAADSATDEAATPPPSAAAVAAEPSSGEPAAAAADTPAPGAGVAVAGIEPQSFLDQPDSDAGEGQARSASITGPALALLAILVGAGAIATALTRRRRGADLRARIELLDHVAVGPKQKVVCVRVGGRELLLGATDKDIRLLADVSAGSSAAMPASVPSMASNSPELPRVRPADAASVAPTPGTSSASEPPWVAAAALERVLQRAATPAPADEVLAAHEAQPPRPPAARGAEQEVSDRVAAFKARLRQALDQEAKRTASPAEDGQVIPFERTEPRWARMPGATDFGEIA